MPLLKEISIEDKPLFDAIAKAYPTKSCERCFSNIFMWKRDNMRFYTEQNRIFAYHISDKYLQYPIGADIAPEELMRHIKQLRDSGYPVKYVFDANPKYFQLYPNAVEYFNAQQTEDDYDYIYQNQNIVSLKGAKLRKKHNLIRQFERYNPNYSLEVPQGANFAEFREYMLQRAVSEELLPMQNAFEFFDKLHLMPLVLKDEHGQIVAGAIMGEINDSIYSVHYEKFEKEIHGAAQCIVLHEAEFLLKNGISEMNREQDLGLEHLRQAKESWAPSEMFKRLNLVEV